MSSLDESAMLAHVSHLAVDFLAGANRGSYVLFGDTMYNQINVRRGSATCGFSHASKPVGNVGEFVARIAEDPNYVGLVPITPKATKILEERLQLLFKRTTIDGQYRASIYGAPWGN